MSGDLSACVRLGGMGVQGAQDTPTARRSDLLGLEQVCSRSPHQAWLPRVTRIQARPLNPARPGC